MGKPVLLEHSGQVVNVVYGERLSAVDSGDRSVVGKPSQVVNADEIAVCSCYAKRLTPGVREAELGAMGKAVVEANL